MDATTTQWSTQGGFGVLSKPMELIASSRPVPQEIRRTRPQKEQALNCPRCNSTNTKFCYYNNYSLSQPRYFCKTCRRYWTEGGSLRNVPVGGGSRKNKRSSSSSSASSSSSSSSTTSSTKIINSNISKLSHDHHLGPPIGFNPNPSKMMIHEGQDLNIAYPPPPPDHQHQNPTSSSSPSPALSIDLLKCTSGITSMGLSMSLNSFMHMPHVPDSSSSAGFHHHHHPLLEFKPTSLGFSGGYHHDHHGFGSNGYGNLQGLMQQETGTGGSTTGGAKLLFPVEELKQLPSDTAHEFDQNRGQGADSSNGYWNGVFGGGSW